ncbi:murein hydrolase activator EnvC family protein [Streptomyces kurssanovii]|uniref:murein hydrolase activator EnvC family protein n=1 Tax=Streptomyces kurssanovii TaxID=67312 RepID=UPI003F4DA15A
MNCAFPASVICRIFAVPALAALAVTGCLTPAAAGPARAGPAIAVGAPDLRSGTGPSWRERHPRLVTVGGPGRIVTVGGPGIGGLMPLARGSSPPGAPAGPTGTTAGHRPAAPDPDADAPRSADIDDGATTKAPDPVPDLDLDAPPSADIDDDATTKAPGPDPDAPRSWPVGAPRPLVVRGWEPPSSPYGPGHRGVDLAAAAGTPVRAAASGTVSFAGSVAGRGVLTITLTGTGDPSLRTTYEPVRPLVDHGTAVTAGQVVATVEPGASHCQGCLHWGLRRGTEYLDPLTLLPPWILRRGPSRLLPVFGIPAPRAAVAALSPTASAGAADLLHAALLLAVGAVAHRALRRLPRGAGPAVQSERGAGARWPLGAPRPARAATRYRARVSVPAAPVPHRGTAGPVGDT